MMPLFIRSGCAISTQNTFENGKLGSLASLSGSEKAHAIHPDYKTQLSPIVSRRMSPAVKMGVTAAKQAVRQAGISNLGAIITGTGLGCIEDTETFLNLLIDNKEEFLTPTSFIQSTHNTVAAQIALNLKCQSYNTTYVQSSNSFPSTLLDAQLQFQTIDPKNILVGGVDELGKEFIDYMQLNEPLDGGIKIPFAEGASFFILSNEQNGQECNQLVDIECKSALSKDAIEDVVVPFLNKNDMNPAMIDLLVLGNNGDKYDDFYTILADLFDPSTPKIEYKNLCGEFYTAPAFGFWLADSILKHQFIPHCLWNSGNTSREINTVLIYNHFKARDHSLILLKR